MKTRTVAMMYSRSRTGISKGRASSNPLHCYAERTAIAVISTMISGTAKAAAVNNVLAGN